MALYGFIIKPSGNTPVIVIFGVGEPDAVTEKDFATPIVKVTFAGLVIFGAIVEGGLVMLIDLATVNLKS